MAGIIKAGIRGNGRLVRGGFFNAPCPMFPALMPLFQRETLLPLAMVLLAKRLSLSFMQHAFFLIAATVVKQVGTWRRMVRTTLIPAAAAAVEPYGEDIRMAVNTYLACLVAVAVFII